mmetsp:Transcript_14088/g.30544  ORF Transcript_14088/g.30544 Transcript_14088/m.30544 type:complete len:84 (+) Transcript_14088:127-378(+)
MGEEGGNLMLYDTGDTITICMRNQPATGCLCTLMTEGEGTVWAGGHGSKGDMQAGSLVASCWMDGMARTHLMTMYDGLSHSSW